MIKRLIDKLLGKPPRASKDAQAALASGKRVEVPKSEHGIDPVAPSTRTSR